MCVITVVIHILFPWSKCIVVRFLRGLICTTKWSKITGGLSKEEYPSIIAWMHYEWRHSQHDLRIYSWFLCTNSVNRQKWITLFKSWDPLACCRGPLTMGWDPSSSASVRPRTHSHKFVNETLLMSNDKAYRLMWLEIPSEAPAFLKLWYCSSVIADWSIWPCSTTVFFDHQLHI